MLSRKEPDGGCLAVLSSCFKGRDGTGSEDLQPPRPTNAVTVEKNSSPTAQQRESTPSISQQSKTAEPSPSPSSAIVGSGSSSSVQVSDQISSPTKLPGTQLSLWQEAYETADGNTQKWIDENVQEWTENTNPFPELVDLVRSSEKKHDEKVWKVEIGGRAISPRDYTNKVTCCLTAIGDIAINFAPAPSPIVWNAVKKLLQTNVSQMEDLVCIMGCTDMVLCLIRRGIVYQEVYLSDHPVSNSHEDLRTKLVRVYKSCLEFLAFVHEELKQGNLKRFFSALLEPGHGKDRVLDVKALEQELESSARACEAVVNQTRSNKHLELLKSLQLPLKKIDDGVIAVLAKLEEREKTKVMDYISTIRVGGHHNEKCTTRTEGTCEWLVAHKKFREWEESSCSSMFWLQGSMGSGKSYLSSKVIDRYLVCEEDGKDTVSQHDEGFGFFYCYRSDPSRRTTVSILRSYIRQLSEVPGRPGCVHRASVELWKSGQNIQNDLTITKCKDTLMEFINGYPRVTLVLDALDECEDETKRELAELFQDLMRNSRGILKIFIASRKELDIEGYLEPFQDHRSLVYISTSDNAGDIERFITNEMTKVAPQWKSISDETKLRVKSTLVTKSDGMFRWAYLQWQYLKKFRMNTQIVQRLESLPQTLSAAYDEIYNRFEPDDFQRLMLQRAIRWVLFAKRPLNTMALLAAIETESERVDGDKAFDKSDLSEPTLEYICQDLLARDPVLDIWKFPHASVAEHFLLKAEPWIQCAKADIAISLITLLRDCCKDFDTVWPPAGLKEKWEKEVPFEYEVSLWFDGFEPDPNGPLNPGPLYPRHPLQRYTHREWFNHVNDIPAQDPKLSDVVQVLKLFLGDEGPRRSSAEYKIFCKYIVSGMRLPYTFRWNTVTPSWNSAFGIIAMNLTRLLPGWWDKDIDLSELNADGQDLLTIAAMTGHASLCEDLLLRGCEINRKVDSKSQSALGAALGIGRIDIVEYLLRQGANPNLAMNGQSLLCLASSKGVEYIRAMLDAGADPNIHCSKHPMYGCADICALSMAASQGDIDGMKALVEAGAEVNPKYADPDSESPLESAVRRESNFTFIRDHPRYDCSRLLLELGADANIRMDAYLVRYQSPLEAAVSVHSTDFARALIEHGADIETPMELQGYGNILAYAVEKGDVDFARFLINHGADAHSPLKLGDAGSILTAASFSPESSLDMLKFVIEEVHVDLRQLEWPGFPRQERGLMLNYRFAKREEDEEKIKAQIESLEERKRYLSSLADINWDD
ncbi:ankyrin repeat [Fusarium longipes]|uniref:Ankyrin repeat n=1 Tax=Fusarium longipes TaxID=694270 RepID=A0A395SM90_9HYPO|nr:ankyrin repeat [Fusarium longipes]